MNNEPVARRAPDLGVSSAPKHWVAWSALALVISTIAAAGVWYLKIYGPTQAHLGDALASDDRAFTALGGQLHALHEKLSVQQVTLDARETAFADLSKEVSRLSAALAAPAASTANLLRLARVEHLVKLADFSLRLSRDLAQASFALQLAQAELDPGVARETALLQALESDQAALAAVVEPDVRMLNMEWAEHAQKLAKLPWRATANVPGDAISALPDMVSGWRGILSAVWQDLRRLVEIREVSVTDVGALDPAREGLVKAGLQTEIATLRYALMRRDQQTVQVSTVALIRALDIYFVADDPQVSALRVALVSLSQCVLAPALPSLRASLTAFADFRRTSLAEARAAESIPSPPVSSGHSDPQGAM